MAATWQSRQVSTIVWGLPHQSADYSALRAAFGGCALYVLRHSGSQ